MHEKYQINENPALREDLSLGEDLERLIKRIQGGDINKTTMEQCGEKKQSFKIDLIASNEGKLIERGRKGPMKKFAHKNSIKSENIYSYAGCRRRTYLIDVEDDNSDYSDEDSDDDLRQTKTDKDSDDDLENFR